MRRLLFVVLMIICVCNASAQNGPVGGNGAEPVFSGGGTSINDTIKFPVKLAEDVSANDPAFVTGYTYDGQNVFPAAFCAKPETTFTPLFAAVSHDGSRLFQVYKTTLGLPYGIWSEEDFGYTALGSHTTSTNSTAYAQYGGFSSSRDNSVVICARFNSPYVIVYRWDNDAQQYVQHSSPFATAPDQQHFNSIAINHDGSKIALAANSSPFFVTYTWDSVTEKYVKDTNSSDAMTGKARATFFVGTTNDLFVGAIGYSGDCLAKYTWDSVN